MIDTICPTKVTAVQPRQSPIRFGFDDVPRRDAGQAAAVLPHGTVHVVCGIYDLRMALAGLTAAEIRLALTNVLNTECALETYVDERRVAWGYRLRDGERLKFVRPWGRKGAGSSDRLIVELGPASLEILDRIAVALEGKSLGQPPNSKAQSDSVDGLPRMQPPRRHPPSKSASSETQQHEAEPPRDALDRRLANIERLISTMQATPAGKEWYNVREVAEMTARYGVTSYKEWTIRDACNQGRVPGAKRHGGRSRWLIPHTALMSILNEGLSSPNGPTSEEGVNG
jgi:hypothetical protein